jgi:N-methylhydantoinase B
LVYHARRGRPPSDPARREGAPNTTDPVLFQILHNRFTACAEEIGMAVARNAYSTLLKGQGDASSGIFTAEGALISHPARRLNHIASLRSSLAALLEDYSTADIEDGDVFVQNDPYRGGIHSNDVCIFRPVFYEGGLRYWTSTLVHVADLGGLSAGGLPAKATELWHEGLVIPPLKLYERGRESDALFRLFAANSRTPVKLLGDLRALVAGANFGAERVLALLRKYGAPLVAEIVAELIAYSERRMRQELARLPDGEYHGSYRIDDDGQDFERRFQVEVTIRVRGADVTVDLTGTDPQARGPINASVSQTLSGVMYALRCYVDPTIPLNEGCWRPLDVILPEGTLVNPRMPAPCNARMMTVMAVIEAILQALAPVAPAERGAIAASSNVQVLTLGGVDHGRYWIHLEPEFGGTGARSIKDGVDSSGAHILGAGGGGIPIEACELEYPLRYESYELWTDSGGPGAYRGGLGIRKEIHALSGGELNVRADRITYPPPGVLGGLPGKGGGYILNEGTPSERRLPSKETNVPVRAGDRITVYSSGGGGFGPPAARDPERVRRDVRVGRVSAESARRDYGVVLDPDTLEVDRPATEEARGTPSPSGRGLG